MLVIGFRFVSSFHSSVVQIKMMTKIPLLIAMLLLIKCSNQQDLPQLISGLKADIVFIVDASGSVTLANFQKVLLFLANFTQLMSSNDVRFGLIRFATSATKLFDLNTYSNQTDLEKAIMDIRYTAGGTYTHLALKLFLDSQMFSVANGGRENAPDIVFTLTDGVSMNRAETAAQAERVKLTNVTMFAIGIGAAIDLNELETLSTKKEYVLLAKNFDDLMTLVTPLLNFTSTAIAEIIANDTAAATNLPTEYTMTATNATTPSTTTSTNEATPSTTTATSAAMPSTTTAATTVLMTTTGATSAAMPSTTTAATTVLMTTTGATIATTLSTTTATNATTESATTALNTTITSTTAATTQSIESTTTSQNLVEKDTFDICHEAHYVRGVAQLPYPEDCTKIIHCYHNPLSNKTVAVIRRCPLGHFWNQQTSECAPSWTVQCPFDKCKNESKALSPLDSSRADDDDTVTYPMPGKRRGYYKCIKGKSHPRCCPKHYAYAPETGCYRNRGLSEECGPEVPCKEGISLCKKLPVWANRKSYLENSIVLGHYPVSCVNSDFNIIDCKCDGQMSKRDQPNPKGCAPLFHTRFTVENCSEEVYYRPIVFTADRNVKVITLKLTLSLPSSHFQVLSTPKTCFQDCYSFKLWGDSDTIRFAMKNKRYGVVSQATILWKNATGNLDFVIMLHGEQLTFGVAQSGREVVTSVETFWTNKSFACAQDIKALSEFKNSCIMRKLEVSDCYHQFNNIYGNN